MKRKTMAILILAFLMTSIFSISVVGLKLDNKSKVKTVLEQDSQSDENKFRISNDPTAYLIVGVIYFKIPPVKIKNANVVATDVEGNEYPIPWYESGSCYLAQLPVNADPNITTDYNVTVSVIGYIDPEPQTAHMTIANYTGLVFYVSPGEEGTGDVGAVLLYKEEHVVDASVSISNKNGKTYDMPYEEIDPANNSWAYIARDVPVGEYEITISEPNFITKTETITVREATYVEIEINLIKKSKSLIKPIPNIFLDGNQLLGFAYKLTTLCAKINSAHKLEFAQ